MLTSPYYPYPPRPGHALESVSLAIADRPSLDVEGVAAVTEFERRLYGARLGAAVFPRASEYAAAQGVEPLEDIWRRKVNRVQLGVSYFATATGRSALLLATGRDVGPGPMADITERLYGLDTRDVDTEVLDKLEGDSIGYEEQRLTRAFIRGRYKGSAVPDPHIATLYSNPGVLVEKLQGYQLYKGYLQHVLQDVGTGSQRPEVAQAASVITTLYRRRVNNLLALLYADAFRLMHQHEQSGGLVHFEHVAGLEAALPLLRYVSDDAPTAEFLQRMDRYRFGVSSDKEGKFTWLSPEATELAAIAERGDVEVTEVPRALYGDIDPSLLETTKVSGDTVRGWLSDVLGTYGWLSAHTDWNAKREGPAADGKWQVIVSDKFKSLETNDRQRIVKVPQGDRSVLSAVAVGSHEIAHVIQHENKRALGRLAILERIGLDTAADQTEAGGVWQEQIARGMLTGTMVKEIAGTGYLQALKVKADGGTYGDAVGAYYYDLLRRNPHMPTEDAAERAVNSVRRIYRSGGMEFGLRSPVLTNTQTLSYLEQRLLYEALPEEQRRLLLVGGVTVANLVQLAEYGLVNTAKITLPEKMPWELLYPHVKRAVGV